MKNFDDKWNFDADELAWENIVGQVFKDFSIQNVKHDFKYNLSQMWPKFSVLNDIKKEKKTLLAINYNGKIAKHSKALNIQNIIHSKKLKNYHCNGDVYNRLGHDGKWELALACHDLIKLWSKKKFPKTVKVLITIDNDIFFQCVKVLSLQVVLSNIFKVLKIKSNFKIDLIISDKMYTNVDPKSNLIRLSYALFASSLLAPSRIILRPLPGITGDDSWRLAANAFHIINLETDILNHDNIFQGTPYFENSVKSFSSNVWGELQKLCKMPDGKMKNDFIVNLAVLRLKDLDKRIEQREVKLVGVNDFVSPAVNILNVHQAGYGKNIENNRMELTLKLVKCFKKINFTFLGEQNKLTQILNEVYQLFALININVNWKKIDSEISLLDNKVNRVVVVSKPEQVDQFMEQWKSTTAILIIFENANVHVKSKSKVHFIPFHKNPFQFLSNLAEAVK
jgi:hypothetical protein